VARSYRRYSSGFCWRDGGKLRNPSVRLSLLQARFELRIFCVHLRSIFCLSVLARRKWQENVRNGRLRKGRTEEKEYEKERVKRK